MDFIEKALEEGISLRKELVSLKPQINELAQKMIKAIESNGKILLCGNGGSAADALHTASELAGMFKKQRKALPAFSLTSNPCVLTSLGNDFGFETVFEKQVEGLGRKGDLLIGITTSGNSENVLRAVKKAKELGIECAMLLGNGGGKASKADCLKLIVPNSNTPRIQEAHITILHIVCEIVEKHFFGD